MLFNKQVDEKRYKEVYDKLQEFNWYPKQTNAFELYEKAGKWSAIETSQLTYKENFTDDWVNIPQDMLEYIRGLKEFDSEIFKEITGLDDKPQEMTLAEVCKELGRTIKIKK